MIINIKNINQIGGNNTSINNWNNFEILKNMYGIYPTKNIFGSSKNTKITKSNDSNKIKTKKFSSRHRPRHRNYGTKSNPVVIEGDIGSTIIEI